MSWWKIIPWIIGVICVLVGQQSDNNETTKGCYGLAIAVILNFILTCILIN